PRDSAWLDGVGLIGVEHFKKIAESFALGLQAKLFVSLQCLAIQHGIIIERDAVETEIAAGCALIAFAFNAATLNVVERGRAEGQGGLRGITAATDDIDVGCVIRTSGGSDLASVENPFVEGQHFAGACGHQHNVDKILLNDLFDDVPEFSERAIANFGALGPARFPPSPPPPDPVTPPTSPP